MKAKDITLHVGDLIHDDTLCDIGILLERYDSHRDYDDQPPSDVTVWRTFWCKAGWENYSEEGLKTLLAMDVFTCYSTVCAIKKQKKI